MPINKKQHYVPKVYLKNFSYNDEKIDLLNIKNNKIIKNIPYKNQCYEDYFYGKDLKIENYLSSLETSIGRIFRNIIDNTALGKTKDSGIIAHRLCDVR